MPWATVIEQAASKMRIRYILILLLITGAGSACKKAYDVVAVNVPQSRLNVINSTQSTINYYLNGTRQNTASSIYPAGYTGYLNVASGNNDYQFRPNGSTQVLFDKQLNLTDSTTLYVTGTTADKAFFTLDKLTTPATGANVRFVHTADGAGPLSITVNDTLVYANQAYKTISPFKAVSSGLKTLKVYAGNATVPSATQKITFSLGNIYTLYTYGVPNGTGQSALTVGVFVNR